MIRLVGFLVVTVFATLPLLGDEGRSTGATDGATTKKTATITGLRYRLADGRSEIVAPHGWKVHRPTYEGCIGVLSTDEAKTHSHHIVVVSPKKLEGKTALAYAKERFAALTEGDEITEDSKWLSAPTEGGKTHRRIARANALFDEDEPRRDVYLVFEVKQVDQLTYCQIAFFPASAAEKLLKETALTMNALKPIPKSDEEAEVSGAADEGSRQTQPTGGSEQGG